MLEKDMKNKLCMKNLQMARLIALLQTAVGEMDQEAIAAELKNNSFCAGSECAHWTPDLVREEQTIKPDEPEPPEQLGWHKHERIPGKPNAVFYRWVPGDTGQCGLITKQSECNASCG